MASVHEELGKLLEIGLNGAGEGGAVEEGVELVAKGGGGPAGAGGWVGAEGA